MNEREQNKVPNERNKTVTKTGKVESGIKRSRLDRKKGELLFEYFKYSFICSSFNNIVSN
jgi:hypothetical protein